MSKRNAIIAAATRLFSKNGFQGTVIAELSSQTGAATGTIFHHFKNKEDLFFQVIGRINDDIFDQFRQHQRNRSAKNGLEMVLQSIAFYLQLASRREDQFLILHRHDPYQMTETNPDLRTLLEEIYNRLLEIFEEGIHKGLDDGSVQVEDPRKTAMVLFAMVDGIVRLHTYRIYDAGALFESLIDSCKKLLEDKK